MCSSDFTVDIAKHLQQLEIFKFFAAYPFILFFNHLFILRATDRGFTRKKRIYNNQTIQSGKLQPKTRNSLLKLKYLKMNHRQKGFWKDMERCEMDDFDITKSFYHLAFNETKM
jgi:hypothetical protein